MSAQQTILGGDQDVLSSLDTRGLTRLRVAAASVVDLSPLEGSNIEELELSFTLVEDLTSLFDLPRLRKLRLFANPLSATAYDEQLPMLRERIPALESAPRDEWWTARQIWDAGIRLAYGSTPRQPTMLVAPGMRERIRWARIGDAAVARGLRGGIDGLWREGYIDPSAAPLEELFFCPYVTGTAVEAKEWIGRAELSTSEIAGYRRLLERFPHELFFRDLDIAIDQFEARYEVKVPAGFRRQRVRAIAGIRPIEPTTRVRFFGFDELTYEIGLLGSSNQDRIAMERDICRVLPVGESTEPGRVESVLSIRLDNDSDLRVYEYQGVEWLYELRRMQRPIDALGNPVFGSWPELLGSIDKIVSQ